MAPGQGLKLKLSTGGSVPPPSPGIAQTPSAKTPGSALKLTFKTPGAPASATEQPVADPLGPPVKQKRKYTKKPKTPNESNGSVKSRKRSLEDDGSGEPGPKRTKSLSIKLPAPNAAVPSPLTATTRTPSIKISINKPKTPKTATSNKFLVLKAKGQKPERPLGVGYDSEAEDAEDDPAIESQFILRMTPCDDCDTLRKAIEDRTIGDQCNVSFRFWDREGRRATVKIKDHHYAAVLVDLPCIIEGTKSWDKKGWYKAADICQMLLVLGQAKNDKEAQEYPLPPDIKKVYDAQDRGLYQYPHGLTPPMHYVRKRRFRKRTSYRTIEAVEEEIERLITLDEEAKAAGGESTFETVDPEILRMASEEEDADEDDTQVEADGYGEADEEADGMSDDDEMAQMMLDELAGDEEAPLTAISANEAALHALHEPGGTVTILPTTEGGVVQLVESPAAETPATDNTEGSDDDDDDEDDDAGDEEVEVNEEELAAQQERAQLREEIADLEQEVAIAKQNRDATQNQLLRNRANQRLKALQQDLELKKSILGEDED